MSFRLDRLAAGTLLALLSTTASAQVTVSGPANGSNCFPFGCSAGSRYQQVYAASAFPGAISIGEISFFAATNGAGELNAMTFDLYLSTTSAAVDGLSGTFDANLGTSTSLFGTYTIGGASPSVLTFTGTPYAYDPGTGNLLLDVRVSAISAATVNTFFVARVDEPGGNYSRMQDFGAGSAGYGLDTRFGPARVASVPEPSTVALLAGGLLALGAAARRRRPA